MFIENRNSLQGTNFLTEKYIIEAQEWSKKIKTNFSTNKVLTLVDRINNLNADKDNSILFDALFHMGKNFLIKATNHGPVHKITILNDKQKIAFSSIDGIISSLFDKIIIDKHITADYNYTLGINLINEQLKRNYKMELTITGISGILIPFSFKTYDSLTKEEEIYRYQ